MEGRTRGAGAVAGIMGPRNPVLAARAVMERSENVLLVGEGAMAFCREQGSISRTPPISIRPNVSKLCRRSSNGGG